MYELKCMNMYERYITAVKWWRDVSYTIAVIFLSGDSTFTCLLFVRLKENRCWVKAQNKACLCRAHKSVIRRKWSWSQLHVWSITQLLVSASDCRSKPAPFSFFLLFIHFLHVFIKCRISQIKVVNTETLS